MKTSNYFIKGKNNIVFVGDNFREWFGNTSFIPTKKAILHHKKLEKSMNDNEIFQELKPEPVTLAHVAYAMEHSKDILKNGYSHIFYVKDDAGVLRTVSVNWYGDGWHVGANSVGDPYRWGDGDRVFSRKFLDTKTPSSSDTLSLGLENRLDNVEKTLRDIRDILMKNHI